LGDGRANAAERILGGHSLELLRHAGEYDDSIGELGMFAAEWPARQGIYARVFRRVEQGLQEIATDEAAGSRDQGDSWRGAHVLKLNKINARGVSGFSRVAKQIL
jgi:hypothetical protein